jgi:hypothetical protein
MCQITMHHTIKYHIKTTDLLQQLGIQSMEHSYHPRLLRWAGHVARMDFSRTPRKLLTGFLQHKRPTGRPTKTWGHTLTDALKLYEIDIKTWITTAQDRSHWRLLTSKLITKHPTPKLAPIEPYSFSFRPLKGGMSNFDNIPAMLAAHPYLRENPATPATTSTLSVALAKARATSFAARIAAVYMQPPPNRAHSALMRPPSDWEHEHKHDFSDDSD